MGPARLVTLCGLSVAKYLLLTSKEVNAEQALRWGLVHRVAPAAATEERALTLAAAVAEHPPEAVARLKRMLHDWDDVEGRSRVEGEGQVEWQRSGPDCPTAERSRLARGGWVAVGAECGPGCLQAATSDDRMPLVGTSRGASDALDLGIGELRRTMDAFVAAGSRSLLPVTTPPEGAS